MTELELFKSKYPSEQIVVHKILNNKKKKIKTHIIITNNSIIGVMDSKQNYKYYEFKFQLPTLYINILKLLLLKPTKIKQLFTQIKKDLGYYNDSIVLTNSRFFEKKDTTTISYVMLCDLKPMYEHDILDKKAIHKEINRSHENICSFIKEIYNKYKEEVVICDRAHFFISFYYGNLTDGYIYDIANILLDKGYFVKYGINKNYIVIFTIDHTKVEVHNKDSNKNEIIDLLVL